MQQKLKFARVYRNEVYYFCTQRFHRLVQRTANHMGAWVWARRRTHTLSHARAYEHMLLCIDVSHTVMMNAFVATVLVWYMKDLEKDFMLYTYFLQ